LQSPTLPNQISRPAKLRRRREVHVQLVS
jgi:hypothetical protein